MENRVPAFAQQWRMKHVRAYRWVVFSTVTMGTFMVNLDSSIVTLAFPTFSRLYQAGPQRLQWVMIAYLLSITAVLPTVGFMADVYGRKRFFLWGIGIFTAGSALCAISSSLMFLDLSRIVQGLGASMIMGNVMSIVTITFPQGERGRPLGMIGSVVAAGTLIGPALGGVLIPLWGWRSIFAVNIPFGGLALLAGLWLLEPMVNGKSNASNSKGKRLDFLGAVLFAVAMAALITFVSNGTSWGWSSVVSMTLLVGSAAAFAVFIRHERKTDIPLIAFELFRIPDFTLGNVTNFVCYAVLMFPPFVTPLLLDAIHISTLHTGLLMAIQPIATIVISPFVGRLADRFNKALISTVGFLIVAFSLVLMSTIHMGSQTMWIAFAIASFGAGIAVFSSPNNVAVMESVPPTRTGLAGSLLALTRNFGKVTSITLAGLALTLELHGSEGSLQFVRAAHTAYLMASFLAGVGVIISGFRLFRRQASKPSFRNKTSRQV
ncbi:MFS transporter [Alicyclobacillus tolerans]|uniref:MFS transporter n=1 Tax=Alicyclobacillus tolerans TaxID=90970 RepID=UPI001F40ACBE|nr:MFS transporter [Alicyclobacillus tolerans]MCF8563135.1 MFS transporter [Alicyclobacillus tolerans]